MGTTLKFNDVDASWDIRPGEFDVVIAELKVGKKGLRIALGLSAKDAKSLGRALVDAGKRAGSWKRAGTSRRIAAQLLKKASGR